MEISLQAVRRQTFGKNEARRLRCRGLIPAVVYGKQREATPIAVDPKRVLGILTTGAGMNAIIGLTFDDGGEPTNVLIKEYQLEPISNKLLHADFYRLAMDKPIQVTVHVVLSGEAKGVKQQAGLLDFVTRDLVIECLPRDIPENIVADVSELMLGQSIRVRDLPKSDKWRPITGADNVIAHVVMPREEVLAPPTAVAEAPAEPEVIRKGKAERPEEEAEVKPERPERAEKTEKK